VLAGRGSGVEGFIFCENKVMLVPVIDRGSLVGG